MSNPTPILNNINAFDATKGTTISFNIIGGTDIVRSNIVYIYDLSTNDLICTHLYISTESIHELPPNTDPSIVYASGKSSADFVNNKNYYLQIQTFTNTAGTAGGSGMSVAKTFWCLFNPALSVNAIPAAISTTSYNVGATYTTNITDVTIPVTNIIQQYKFDLYTATGTLVQTSGNIIGSGEQEGTSTTYNITYNFSGLVVNNSYYVVVTTTSTEGMTVSAQSNTFTVSIDTPTVGGAIVNNNACDGYISVVSNLSDEYGGHVSGEMASFETDSVNNVSSLKVNMEPIQEGSGTPSPTNIRPIRGHSGVNAYVSPTQSADDSTKYSQEFNVSLTPTSTDKVPYTFKAVGRDVYGDRESDKIVGGTVAWNQLVLDVNTAMEVYGITRTKVTDGDKIGLRYTGTSTSSTSFTAIVSTPYVTGHKYLLDLGIASLPTGARMSLSSIDKKTSGVYANYIGTFGVFIASGTTVDFTVYPQAIDLTQMFGTTIADYIYSLEQANAGAGVAWFRRYFQKDYYPYDPGTLRSVEGVSAHETVGKNLLKLDESEMVSVGWNRFFPNPINAEGTYSISCKNSFGGTGQRGGAVSFYNETNGNRIGNILAGYGFGCDGATTEADKYISDEQAKAKYIGFNCNSGGATFEGFANAEIQIELGSTATAYEPYQKHTYPLDSSLTLRGVPKLVDGKLAFDGDVYPPSGEVQRRYGVVDLGTLNWQAMATSKRPYFLAPFSVMKSGSSNVISTWKYKWTAYASAAGEFTTTQMSSTMGLYVYNDGTYTDATAFKTAMSGVMLVYELATPTTETAEPFINPQVVDNRGTEAYITTGIVPVGHDTTYLTRDIFGGTLDLVTGVLTVDRAMVSGKIESLPANTYTNIQYGRLAKPNDSKNRGNIGTHNLISSMYEVDTATNNWNDANKIGKMFVGADYNWIWVGFPVGTTLAEMQSVTENNEIVYELATPQTYQLTPHQIQTLVGQNNVWSDAGNVDVTFNLPITNLLVKRQDTSDTSGNWLTLYSQPITQASDMDFTYIDFLNQHGKTYRYALVPLLTQQQGDVDVEIEGGYTVSDDVLSVFDGVFIANSNGSQKLKAATEYGDLETNQDVGVLTTIGGKYPFVVSNSNLNYHSGSISALIVPSDFYTNGDLDRLDIVERRETIEQFLTDKTAKILKDWNGNIWLITFIENVEVSFVDDYGMGLGTLSAKWVEIGDVNDQTDLKQTGLI